MLGSGYGKCWKDAVLKAWSSGCQYSEAGVGGDRIVSALAPLDVSALALLVQLKAQMQKEKSHFQRAGILSIDWHGVETSAAMVCSAVKP